MKLNCHHLNRCIIIFLLLTITINKISYCQLDKTKTGFDDYIITTTGDTLKGEVNYVGFSPRGHVFKLKTKDGEKQKYDGSQANEVNHDGILYRPHQWAPAKNKGKKLLMMLLAQDGAYQLFASESTALSASMGPGLAPEKHAGGWNEFYLFKGEEYIDQLESKNYKQLLEKYFTTCESINKLITSEDFKCKETHMKNLRAAYYQDCYKK